jgi:REP element-mobilizing transposase RayT
MPQSLSCLLLHLIFSTKDRFPLLRDDDLLTRTHAYLGGILREADCPLLTIGGTADHVHAFFQLSRTLQVAKLVELIKSNSSRWVKTQGIHNFAWQRGYACFSVGKSQAEAVATYIRNQAEHHRHISYQDEVREFFRRYEVAFDVRYVWD